MSLDRGWVIGRRRRRGRSPSPFLFLGIAVPVVALAYQFFVQGLQLTGQVVDASNGYPIAGVQVTAPSASARSDAFGVFRLAPVRPWDLLSFSADGYLPTEFRVGLTTQIAAPLSPKRLRILVRDAETGQPLEAEVRVDNAVASPSEAGGYVVAPIRTGSRVNVSADGYVAAEVAYQGETELDIALSRAYRGIVRDGGTGQPIRGARVVADGRLVTTDAQGRYDLAGRPASGRGIVLAPGYSRAAIDFSSDATDVALERFEARGLYLTFFGAGHPELRGRAMRLLQTTELNTVVIDVKGDRGWIAYPSEVPLAEKIGANEVHTLPNVTELLRDLKAKEVYTIARIVLFKDNVLAHNGQRAGLDVAIKNSRTGGPWIDGEGLGWVDPFQEKVWEYNIALAVDAASKGFDEIQFDYVRFPTDPSAGNSVEQAVYARPFTEANRVDAIAGFLERAREKIHKAGAFVSIDTFGYTCWADDDLGIGQNLTRLGRHVDYISPMIYPSTFSAGLPGTIEYPTVIREPFEVIYQSLVKCEERVAGTGAILRPWLQYFDDYPWATGLPYNAPEIEAQKKAVQEAKAVGWLFWDPTNRYERGGFTPR